MGNRLEGKVAVVTGGGRGVGRGVALLMAEEGAKVVVNDLGCEVDGSGSSNVPADSVVEEIKARGGEAVANYDNMASMEGGEAVIQQAVDAYGQLDVLANCVGSLRDRMIWQMTPEDWDRVITNNVKSVFAPTKFACILFRQQRGGRIVNMTSDAGLGDVGRSNYAAASEAIIGLTRTVGRDMGRYGVTCNAISPIVETRLFPGSVGRVSRCVRRRADTATSAREYSAQRVWDGKAPAGRTTLKTSPRSRSISAHTPLRTLTATSSGFAEAVSISTRIPAWNGRCRSGATSRWMKWMSSSRR